MAETKVHALFRLDTLTAGASAVNKNLAGVLAICAKKIVARAGRTRWRKRVVALKVRCSPSRTPKCAHQPNAKCRPNGGVPTPGPAGFTNVNCSIQRSAAWAATPQGGRPGLARPPGSATAAGLAPGPAQDL
jgi:hypothetical protein